ncbi:Down syndrome cell adhesion molecule-like protein 1 [Chamberlinius hualienensis]
MIFLYWFLSVPPRWLVEPRDTSVALGHDVIIHCQSEGSPLPIITWMKAEGVQPGNRKDVIVTTSRFNLHSNGSLTIFHAQADDEGYYFCQASNGIDEGLSIAMHLYVNVPPNIKAVNGSVLVKIRQNITLACEVAGDDPLDVTWSRNGTPLPTTKNSRYKLQMTENSPKSKTSQLIIRSTHRDDTGIFTCIAKNTFGDDNANISVIVQEVPDAVKKIKLGKPTSKSVEISWSQPFDGNSPVNGYTVEFRPKEIETGKPLDSKNITTGTEETTLTLTDLKPATQYQIRLFAHNKMGQSNASQVFDLITAEEAPTGPSRDVQITAIDTHTVKVSWKVSKTAHFFHHQTSISLSSTTFR